MARIETSGLDDLIKKLESYGEMTEETADEMLIAGADIVASETKRAIEEAGLVDTGAMKNSVGHARKPKTTKDIRMIDIYPQGADEKGVGNAQKLFALNYGTSHIAPTRCVDIAEKRATPQIEKTMTEIAEKILKQKGLID